MSRRIEGWSPRELRKWFAYALVLLIPGSLVILPVVGLVRLLRAARQAKSAGRPISWVFAESNRVGS